MQGKIAIEEHFAVDEPDRDTTRRLQGNASWANTARRLTEFHDVRLKDMDACGIEYAILSLNAPAIQMILDPKEALAAARRANDFLAEQIAKRPDRFRGLAALPMQDPGAAAQEFTRCVKELGFPGALVNGFTQWGVSDSVVYYDIPEYRPFWREVAALDVPFYLHPRTSIYERSHHYDGHPWLFSSAWGFAAETSVHVLRLIGSGLFDELPRCRSSSAISASASPSICGASTTASPGRLSGQEADQRLYAVERPHHHQWQLPRQHAAMCARRDGRRTYAVRHRLSDGGDGAWRPLVRQHAGSVRRRPYQDRARQRGQAVQAEVEDIAAASADDAEAAGIC